MLIPIKQLINQIGPITGILHIGAHECEELAAYNEAGIKGEDVVWVEAIDAICERNRARRIPNVYNAVITDRDDQDVVFNVANNGMSSSVLELGTHKLMHPHIHYVDKLKKKTITIDSFFARNGLDAKKFNYWVMDIQGAELMALRGAPKSIQYANAMYLEVNEDELYKDCGLIGELDALLKEAGFDRVETLMTRYGWGDALYVRRKPL